MSLLGPPHFQCNHKKLIKTKFSETIYSCIKCNKEFLIIPAKHEPPYPFPPYPPDSPPFHTPIPDYPHYPKRPDEKWKYF